MSALPSRRGLSWLRHVKRARASKLRCLCASCTTERLRTRTYPPVPAVAQPVTTTQTYCVAAWTHWDLQWHCGCVERFLRTAEQASPVVTAPMMAPVTAPVAVVGGAALESFCQHSTLGLSQCLPTFPYGCRKHHASGEQQPQQLAIAALGRGPMWQGAGRSPNACST